MNNFILVDEFHRYSTKDEDLLEKYYQDFRIKINTNKEKKLINVYTLSKNNAEVQKYILGNMFKDILKKGYKLKIEYNPQKFNSIIVIEQKL